MKRILITNDDGIDAKGINILAKHMKNLGEVFVVAPDRERSTASHSITLHRPLRICCVGKNRYIVDGTPSDCVNLSVNWIMKDEAPDVVVSGINHGGNLGDDITYSGTVAAAIEGTTLGIPSVAGSMVLENGFTPDFECASKFTVKLVEKVIKKGIPEGTLLNINVPAGFQGKKYGFSFTSLGRRFYGQEVEEKSDPRSKKYYWIGGEVRGFKNIEGSDCLTVSHGKISVTPIKLDMTDYTALRKLKGWKL